MKKSLIFTLLALALWLGYSQLDLSPSKTSGCAFCSQEVLAAQLVFEGQETLCLVTHKPVVPGHLLITPKRHVERFEDLSSSEIAEIGEMVKKADKAVKKIFGTTGSLLIQKNGREAGQSVPHVHIHYLPATKERSQIALAIRFFLAPTFKPVSPRQLSDQIALYTAD